MEAAVWTSIGVLAAFAFAALFYLGSRIDQLGSRRTPGSMPREPRSATSART
jgi:hypothetical protein